MRMNQKTVAPAAYTHEGAKASRINAEQELRRTVMACMLWEDNFYENGISIAQRIRDLVPQCRPEFVAACAFHARTDMKLRHVPLLLVNEMSKHEGHKKLVGKLLPDVIQRADEITEFMAIYMTDIVTKPNPHYGSQFGRVTDVKTKEFTVTVAKKRPLSAQVKKGLARAFQKFDEYALAKYNRDKDWKLRDVLFLSHAKPTDAQGSNRTTRRAILEGVSPSYVLNPQEELFRKLVDDELEVPNTWEVRLSSGEDKKKVFTELMMSRELGGLAFLRNLRNMVQSNVDVNLIEEYARTVKVDRILPFRFLAAARHVPSLEPVLEGMMFRCLKDLEKLPGRTLVLVDVSGSMTHALSSKSDMLRLDAAYGVAVLLREMCESVGVFTFSTDLVEVPLRRGFALRDAMHMSQEHRSTYMGAAVRAMNGFGYDRLIVITDEQSQDVVPPPKAGSKAYIINVASEKNGVGYGHWTKIDGWSEACIKYISEMEKESEE